MIFPQFVIYVLIYNYLKFRKDLSFTSQDKANYISVALAVALRVYQINAISLVFYSMVRYADYLLYIFINIYGNIRN